MLIQSLNGAWHVHGGKIDTIPAKVPGCVHLDLMANGLLDDPYYRDNERQQYWVGETDWTYSRQFSVTPELLAHESVLLRCHGLDTLATITINGHVVANTDNMYRTYEFDVKALLVAGANAMTVHLASPMQYERRMEAERGVYYAWSVGEHRLTSGSWIRKEPSNFGWDWGPQFVTSGIWRDIELVAYNTARIQAVYIEQDHHDGVVDLTITATLDSPQTLNAQITVQHGANTLTATTTEQGGKLRATVRVENPAFWWINGRGEQPLYTVTVALENGLDTWERRIGLRELRLERETDEWGQSFAFSINGERFFAKGANWIPADSFVARPTRDDYERLIRAAADANMNMLRVWGGGIYEADDFYELCDQYGIAIWQDFMFACGTYPARDEAFLANVRAEAIDNVRRIRHHPCLALWCGNNELEQGLAGDSFPDRQMSWADYGLLFDDLLANIVREHDPARDYIPGSPHTPVGDRNNWMDGSSGDSHLWAVWHGREPFEWYRTRDDRFVSEFGFQSFPQPSTIATFTEPEDRNITSYVMEYHQRSGIGNSTIIHYLLDWFRLSTSFDYTVWLSQILQALAMKYAVEGWRRNMPRQMGALYWQLNDLWAAPSWASIDWFGNYKALHYYARKFYAPILISAVEDKIFVTCDTMKAQSGIMRWALTKLDGEVVDEGEQLIDLPQNGSAHVETLEIQSALEKHGKRNLLLWITLEVEGKLVSENMELFARPKHLNLLKPKIQKAVTQVSEGVYDVTLSTNVPALYVWLDLPDARFSDNFVHLRSEQTIRVWAENINDLAVYSLYDTYH